MSKANKILEIADKNGFDWWGHNEKKCFKYKASKRKVECIFQFSSCIYPDNKWTRQKYSLADLATNKSFLEAMVKNANNSEKILCDDCSMYLYCPENNADCWVNTKDWLQITLTKDLTYNDGRQFWDICYNFIGGDKNE